VATWPPPTTTTRRPAIRSVSGRLPRAVMQEL
jgi:hypothetical protein